MPIQDFINRQVYTQDSTNKLSNFTYINAFQSNMSTGTTDFYTCPAGKRAAVYNFNATTTTGTSAVTPQFKSGGNYYELNSFVAGTGSISRNTNCIILDSGESVACVVGTAGVNVWFSIIEYDDDIPIKTVKVLSLSAGNNTVYTCPANTVAAPYWDNLVRNYDNNFIAAGSPQGVTYQNGSGTSRSIAIYCVPNGDSPGTANQMTNGTLTVSNGNHSFNRPIPYLNAGDSFVINTDASTATQWVYVTVAEFT